MTYEGMTQEEKAAAKKEATRVYMRNYMRAYNLERYKNTVGYHRGQYVSQYDKIKMEEEEKAKVVKN